MGELLFRDKKGCVKILAFRNLLKEIFAGRQASTGRLIA